MDSSIIAAFHLFSLNGGILESTKLPQSSLFLIKFKNTPCKEVIAVKGLLSLFCQVLISSLSSSVLVKCEYFGLIAYVLWFPVETCFGLPVS